MDYPYEAYTFSKSSESYVPNFKYNIPYY